MTQFLFFGFRSLLRSETIGTRFVSASMGWHYLSSSWSFATSSWIWINTLWCRPWLHWILILYKYNHSCLIELRIKLIRKTQELEKHNRNWSSWSAAEHKFSLKVSKSNANCVLNPFSLELFVDFEMGVKCINAELPGYETLLVLWCYIFSCLVEN